VSGGTATLPSLTGLEYRTARDETAELAFLSYVYPGENWALAAYRQVAASYQNSFVRDDVDFAAPGLSLPGEPPGTVYTLFAVGGLVDLEIINYGASFAYEFSDKLSLGVSGIYSTSDLRSVSVRLNGANEGNGGQDEKFVFNLGMLYRLSDSLSLGASYRHGASFDIRAITFQGLTPEGGVANSATEFNVPHQLGVGLAWRPNDSLSVGLEVNHIRYSRLDLDPFRFTGTGLPGAKIAADDGTEIRLGGEYVFLNMNRPFIVRAGIWHDPDHRVGYQSPNPPANIAQAATRILFPQGDDELHYSLGFGWAFDQFQVDVGADLSDLTDIYSLSGVVRF
jgi:long-subunit fatty acid transport protein